MTELNYSFSADPSSAAPSGSDDTWSFCGVKILPGPANTALLHKVRTGHRMMVQPDLAQALQHCMVFRSLDAHAKQIMQIIPALREHPESVKQTLETVRDNGILESARSVWARLSQGGETPHSAGRCRLFILTCDRPEALRRLLESIRVSTLPSEIEGLWVIDDSRQTSSSDANADIIESARSDMGVPVTHFDLAARSHLVAHLLEKHPDNAAAIHFLLDRAYWADQPTHGLARNFALLLSGGHRAFMMDDDTLLRAIKPPLQGERLRFGGANEREAVFYDSNEALTQHEMEHETGPLHDMLRSLGKTLGAILRGHWPGPEELSNVDGEALNGLSAQSPILLTQCGTWGDVGSSSGNWSFFTPATTQKRLLSASEQVETTLGNGHAWFGYRGPSLTPYGVMSALIGVDHTVLLPPYLPAGRNEDILFGIMLQRLYPNSLVMNSGWALPHLPVEDRAQRGQLSAITVKADISLLADWLGRAPEDQWGLPAEQRLAGLADQIDRLAIMELGDLEQLIGHGLLSKRAGLLDDCLTQLAGMNAAGLDGLAGTQAWQTFLESSRDSLLTAIQSPDTHPLVDLLGANDGTANDGEAGLRQKGREFAAALRIWPELVKTATTLPAP